MILGFKPQFVPKILDGTKIHTIRKGNRWKPGMSIQMATGVRTKNYNQFNTDIPEFQKCKSVQKIIIILHIKDCKINNYSIIIDHKIYPKRENLLCELIAKNDGFESIEDFLIWFAKAGDKGLFNIMFSGQIIHWTDFKY